MYKTALGELQLAVLTKSTKHLTLIGKTSDRNINIFMPTLKRFAPQLHDWTFGGTLVKFDLLRASADFLMLASDDNQGILLITCIYFLVNETFLLPLNNDDINNCKLQFAYWLAHGYLPV
jgi:hypothetical protein